MFLDGRKAGSDRRRAQGLWNWKQERSLQEDHGGKAAEIADRDDDQKPFQGGHDFPQAIYIPLTMFSVIFLASPSSIIVLSR